MTIGPKVTMKISQYTDVVDALGSLTRSWTDKRYISGTFQVIKGEERYRGDKQSIIATHRFYIDNPVGLTISEKDKLTLNTTEYDIIFINNLIHTDNILILDIKERT